MFSSILRLECDESAVSSVAITAAIFDFGRYFLLKSIVHFSCFHNLLQHLFVLFLIRLDLSI